MLFRLQNNTPQVYTEESRDFQLFCRLYDCVFNGVRFDSQTIHNINNSELVNDTMLDLYATRVGFFTDTAINSDILRAIIKTFPFVVKNKGNKRGIIEAVTAVIKAENSMDSPNVQISLEDCTVHIYTTYDVKNKRALLEYLEYVLPVGFKCEFHITTGAPTSETRIDTASVVEGIVSYDVSNSQFADSGRLFAEGSSTQNGSEFDYSTQIEWDSFGMVNNTQLICDDNNNSFGTYTDGRDDIDKSTSDTVTNILFTDKVIDNTSEEDSDDGE